MRYQISGKQIDIGEALSTHVQTEIGTTVDKYSQRPTDATVIFSRNAHEFTCDAVVHLSTGLNVQAKGARPRSMPPLNNARNGWTNSCAAISAA